MIVLPHLNNYNFGEYIVILTDKTWAKNYANKTQDVMTWNNPLTPCCRQNSNNQIPDNSPKVSNYKSPGGMQHNSLFWKQHPKRRTSRAALRIQITFLSYLFFNLNKSFFFSVSTLCVFRQIIHAWFHIPCQKEEAALLLL